VVVDLSEDAVAEALSRDGSAPVPGLSLDAVADASRAVSAALDDSDAMGDAPYVLEVSTPGAERTLTEPAHFRRSVRRKLAVTLADGTQLTGRLEEAGEQLVLRVDGPKKGMTSTRRYAWADVARAVVQVDFTRVDDVPLADLGGDDSDDTESDDTESDDIDVDDDHASSGDAADHDRTEA
jgi:ribosome maturation factor RimP